MTKEVKIGGLYIHKSNNNICVIVSKEGITINPRDAHILLFDIEPKLFWRWSWSENDFLDYWDEIG